MMCRSQNWIGLDWGVGLASGFFLLSLKRFFFLLPGEEVVSEPQYNTSKCWLAGITSGI